MTSWLLATHLVCGLVFFVALGVEVPVLAAMRRASSAAALREAVAGFGLNTRIGPPAALGVIATGVALAAHVWSGAPPTWMSLSLGALVINAIAGGAITGRAVIGLRRTLDGKDGPLETAMREQARSPALVVSLGLRAGLVTAIAVLMVLRPDAPTAIELLLAWAVTGALAGAIVGRRRDEATA
jgi:hypothetical protein